MKVVNNRIFPKFKYKRRLEKFRNVEKFDFFICENFGKSQNCAIPLNVENRLLKNEWQKNAFP